MRNLHSVKLARAFVNNVVVPRVKRGKAIVIILRKEKLWNVPELKGVVKYSAAEARAAHLTPNSPGGKAILKHFSED